MDKDQKKFILNNIVENFNSLQKTNMYIDILCSTENNFNFDSDVLKNNILNYINISTLHNKEKNLPIFKKLNNNILIIDNINIDYKDKNIFIFKELINNTLNDYSQKDTVEFLTALYLIIFEKGYKNNLNIVDIISDCIDIYNLPCSDCVLSEYIIENNYSYHPNLGVLKITTNIIYDEDIIDRYKLESCLYIDLSKLIK